MFQKVKEELVCSPLCIFNPNDEDSKNISQTMKEELVCVTDWIFNPSDEELISLYLAKKVNGDPLPQNKIGFISLTEYNPLLLEESCPSYGDQISYYFAVRIDRADRNTRPAGGCGYWSQGRASKIKNSLGVTIGTKNRFTFFDRSLGFSDVSSWRMDEFSLLPTGDWVLYRMKKVRSKAHKRVKLAL